MKEVFRSFEGKLNLDNRTGYIIYDHDDFYEVHFLNIDLDIDDSKIRIPKSVEFEFDDLDKISGIQTDIENGCRKGQVFYNGKWYNQESINKIQKSHNDYSWRKYL